MRTWETEWGQELAKTIASTIAGMATLATNTRPVALGTVAEFRPSPRVTGKRECAKTSQRESWTKTALGHEQVRREGRVSCASMRRTWSERDGGSNSDCCGGASREEREHEGKEVRAKEVPMLHRRVSSVTRRRSCRR